MQADGPWSGAVLAPPCVSGLQRDGPAFVVRDPKLQLRVAARDNRDAGNEAEVDLGERQVAGVEDSPQHRAALIVRAIGDECPVEAHAPRRVP